MTIPAEKALRCGERSRGNSAVKLALGTVQFGMPYGIANQRGQISYDEAAAILNYAWGHGLDTLDTAVAYGESEQRLGQIGVAQWRVISKLPACPEVCADVGEWVSESVLATLRRLRISRLHGLLLHRPQQLLDPQGDGLYQALLGVKQRGTVEKIGISIYDPSELDAIWPRYQFDIVQAPFNVIDRRLVISGWLQRLAEAGAEIHVRSIFLQGLLLMEAGQRPTVFNRWSPIWNEWDHWLSRQGLTPLQACLGFALRQSGIDRVVIGIDSLKQLQEILMSIDAPAIEPPVNLVSEAPDLVNPSRWSLL